MSSIPGLGRSPRVGNGNPLQYSCPENSMDKGAWLATYSPWGRKESDTTEGTEYTHGFHRLLCSHSVHIQGVLRQAAARFSSFLEAHSFGSVSHAGVGRPSASESLILTEHASSCMDQNFLEFWILLFFFFLFLHFKHASK